MKVSLFPLLAAAVFLGAAPFASAQQVKLGTVDMKNVFENYYKTKEAEARINEARNQAKKELEDRMDAYKKASDEIQKLNDEINRPELSKDAKEKKTAQRDEKINDIKNMEREIKEFQVQREKQLNDQTMRMRAGIVDQINKVVNDRVKAENYDLVLDRSGQSLNGVPIILYAREASDFTKHVVKELNAEKGNEKPEAAPAAAAPAAPAAAAPKAAAVPKKTK
jgi:outer membrane protein